MSDLKVLMINGSPHENGNTAVALREMEKIFSGEGISSEIICVGKEKILGCMACYSCHKSGKCSIDDDILNSVIAPKFEACDGIVIGSPVYFSKPNATLLALLDRLFYSNRSDRSMKVAASVACARRGGCSTTFDVLNKYLSYGGMAMATSQYWNIIHGQKPGEADRDEEGKQTVRTLARNMVFLMKSIALGKDQYGLPEKEKIIRTNFIDN